MNPIAKEPVLVGALAAIGSWLLAKYGINVDPQQASEIAGVVLAVASLFARQVVTPVAKLGEPDEEPTRYQPPLRSGNVTVHDPKRPAE